MLKVQNLKKKYGKFHALNGISFEIPKGHIFGFIGQNGAGKTTTMRIITGLLRADSGVVEFDGMNFMKNYKNIGDIVGYVPDYFGVYNKLRAIEYMEFFANMQGLYGKSVKQRCIKLMDMLNIGDASEMYVDDMSRGMQQRLCMARALLHDPKLLVLDEPTSGMDPQSRLEFKKLLKDLSAEGKTIMISSHILPDLSELCNSVGIIDKGEMLYQGNMEDIADAVNVSNPLGLRVITNKSVAVNILKSNELTRAMSIDGNNIQIAFLGNSEEESELLGELINNDVKITSFGRKRDNLEDVFVRLTEQNSERGRKRNV